MDKALGPPGPMGMDREQEADHRLFLGDCLDPLTGLASLPDKSVDHFICDPPYEAEAHTLQRRVKRGGGSNGQEGQHKGVMCLEPLGFDAMDTPTRAMVAGEMARVSRRWVVVFCQVEASHLWERDLVIAGLARRRIGVWVKPDGMPQYTGDRPGMGYESLVFAHRQGASRWNAGGKHGVYTENKIGPADVARSGHPTQKPVALMEALISDFTDPGELVCDPFAGSGTTGVACKRLGRRFIGWESNEKYWAAAVRRIENARQQYELLPRGPRPKQSGLFPKESRSPQAKKALP